jgi:hypothetical protein
MTGAASLRATAAAAAIAAALLIAGCGGDDEPTASVAATATTESTPPATTAEGKQSGKTSTTQKSTTTKKGSSKTRTTTTSKQSSGTATTSKSAPSKQSSKSKKKKKAAPVRTVPIPPARAKVGKAQTFSGDGDKTLGTITLKRSAVVRWTSTGGSFALVDGAKKVSISGDAKSGQTFIAAGDYKSVKVTAKGHWTLSLAELGD